jgi:hypothetical protein
LLALTICAPRDWAESKPSEDQLKAVFLYNFAKFVEWPNEAFASPSAVLRICVLGADRLRPELEETVAGKVISGHPLEVARLEHAEHTGGCHILFVPAELKHPRAALGPCKGKSVLTVGETPQFVEQGGIINFVLDKSHVRFEVNLKAADEARLKISARLLNVAKQVQT